MMNELKRISVLGCGWLGRALALELAAQGYEVQVSRKNPAPDPGLMALKIKMFRVDVREDETVYDTPDFFTCDAMIISFPPGRAEEQSNKHAQQIEKLLVLLRKFRVKKIIFISSTSVYPDLNSEVTEENKPEQDKTPGKELLQAENILMQADDVKVTVIRFGGLIGYDRMPGKFLAGKKNLKDGEAPVNLIHRDDCISIILRVLELNQFGKIYNAVCDAHPIRKDFYTLAAQKAGLALPEFTETEQCNFKIVRNDKLKNELKFQFKYPDPIDVLD